MSNIVQCIVEGCKNLVMSKGNGFYAKLCTKHHKQKYEMPYTNSHRKQRVIFPNGQCVLCAWEGPCDRHRLKMGRDGGEYTQGNVLSLCSNCHRLLHRGLLLIK